MYLFELEIYVSIMLKSGIAGLYGCSGFSFLSNLHTVFHRDAQIYISNKSVG